MYYKFHLYEITRESKSIDTESKLVFAETWGTETGIWGITLNEHRILFWSGKNILEPDTGGGYTTL